MADRAPEAAVAVDRKKAASRETARKRGRPAGAGAEVVRLQLRFEQLVSAGLTIYKEHSLPGVLQCIADAARQVVGARYAALGVLDEHGSGLREFVTSGISRAEADRIGAPPSGHGLLGLVIRQRRPVRTPDIRRHPAHAGFPAHHPSMTSFLGVPIAIEDRILGNLYVTEKEGGGGFTTEDETIAVLLAAQAAAAIDNARLHEESRELLGQVRAMQRQRDLFFAMMNHELRNSLTGVYGWAERLVRVRSPEAVAQAGREVFEGAERTITLLNNLLDLTRLEAGKVRPVWRELDLAAELERTLAGVRPAAEAKGVTLEARRADGLPALRSDPVRLEQILVNLLTNAVRHSPEGGAVVVRVEPGPSDVRFRVTDRGPGIPPEFRARLFEPFERFDPSSGMGSGLGLPISRRLAELLGGGLTVESEPGRGATFTLVLPLEPPRA
jgi:signal transduction histidine kinase